VVARLTPCALSTSNISASALFRTIEASRPPPTLFVDEADAAFANGGNEELRGLLNAGHTPEHAFVIRSIPVCDNWQAKKFSVWCPLAIAAIRTFRRRSRIGL
jgi:putative DNA primase/helicase